VAEEQDLCQTVSVVMLPLAAVQWGTMNDWMQLCVVHEPVAKKRVLTDATGCAEMGALLAPATGEAVAAAVLVVDRAMVLSVQQADQDLGLGRVLVNYDENFVT
jgi:hypothetical protein